MTRKDESPEEATNPYWSDSKTVPGCLLPKFGMNVRVGGSNPMEVKLFFDHNYNIRVGEGTVRRRPLHRGQRHLQGPNRSKHARTQQQQDTMDAKKFFGSHCEAELTKPRSH